MTNFNKEFWDNCLDSKTDPIIIDGTCYHYQCDNQDDAVFKGFDGKQFSIQMNDGRIIHTSSLWYNGKIPSVYQRSDNGKFIQK
jgi:hypothetical protein